MFYGQEKISPTNTNAGNTVYFVFHPLARRPIYFYDKSKNIYIKEGIKKN